VTYRAFRILRAIQRSYPLGVLFLYLGLFAFTFTLIFVFPPGAVAMVFVALAGLLAAVILGALLRWVVHMLARRLLRSGVCPGCAVHRPFIDGLADQSVRRCEMCGAIFLPSGVEQDLGVQV
jgi:hypothetical protein